MNTTWARKPAVAVILCSLSVGLFLIAWLYSRPAFTQDNPFELPPVSGEESLTIDEDSVRWLLKNNTSDDLSIEAIDIAWPQESGNLRQITFNGRIYKGSVAAPTVSLDASILGKEKHRTLKKGKSRELHFKFDQENLVATQDQFVISVSFKDGTVVQFDDSVDEPPGDGLPPDPGEAGKLTLEGIDSDGDGVRDDIQRWIAVDAPSDPLVRKALLQKAEVSRDLLAQSESEAQSIVNVDNTEIAYWCLWYVNGYDDDGFEKANDLTDIHDSLFYNTEERIRAWIAAHNHYPAGVYEGSSEERVRTSCKFDTDTGEEL